MKHFIYSSKFSVDKNRKYLKNISIHTEAMYISRKQDSIDLPGHYYTSKAWNKLMHILTGNKRVGYNIGIWNCRKGLLLSGNNQVKNWQI